MSLGRREFLQVLALAAASGISLEGRDLLAAEPSAAERLYDVPTFGNVSFLHFTDCHAQLLPSHFREPSVNLGVGSAVGRPPHLVGRRHHLARREQQRHAGTPRAGPRAARG